MSAHERHAFIRQQVDTVGIVRVREIVERFHVTDMTARRDIQFLADQGYVERIHGGAKRLAHAPVRAQKNPVSSVHKQYARVALSLIKDVTTVGIGNGVFCQALMRQLCASSLIEGLTVVTYSLDIVGIAVEYRIEERGATVLYAGGMLHGSVPTGQWASRFLRSMKTDIAFIEPDGVDRELGCMSDDPQSVSVIQAFATHTRSLVGFFDHDMWQHGGLAAFCPMRLIDTIITQGDVPSFMLPDIQHHDITICYV